MRTTNPCENLLPATDQLRVLFHSSPELICTIDQNYNLVYVNASFRNFLGYSHEEMAGRSVADLLCEKEVPTALPAAEAIMRGEDKKELNIKLRKKDGSFLQTTWSCHWDAGNAVMFCIGRKVSGQPTKDFLQAGFEERAKKQNHEVNEMLERITDAFFALDEEWRITYANTQCENALALKKEDYLGRNIWEAFPYLVGTTIQQQYYKAMAEKVSVHFKTFLDQFGIWCAIHAYPSATGISVFFRDITSQVKTKAERKKIEMELRKLSLIARETTTAVSIIERDGLISWVNAAYTKLTGYRFEEAFGKKNSVLLCGPDSDCSVFAKMKECFYSNQSFKGEMLAYTKDGRKRWIEIVGQPLSDELGKPECYFILKNDITERRLQDEQVRKLSLYVREMKDMIVVTDQFCSITWVNASFEKTIGYSLQEAKGKKCGELLKGPDTDDITAKQIKQQMEKGEPFRAEILHYPKSGLPCWVEIFGQPFFDEQGNVTEYFTIHRNISERKRLQQQLDEEVAKRQKSITAAVIHTQEKERAQVGRELHDNVNQILTSVKLYQELILSGLGEREELVKKSIDLLLEAINENRNLSRRLSAPTLGHIKLKDSIQELVANIAATHKFTVALKVCSIQDLETGEDLHLAVYRILQEHFTNILKHAQATTVTITAAVVKNKLLLEVTDDGKGFDVQQKRTGIGITNMLMRAESLDGTLQFISAPDEGCTLELAFPLKPE